MTWKDSLVQLTPMGQKVAQALETHTFETSIQDHLDSIHPFVKELKVPPTWIEVQPYEGMAFGSRTFTGRGLVVMLTVDDIKNAQGAEEQWLHLSVSRKSRMPDYEDLTMVRRFFMNENIPAYQVFPKKDEHRNLHDFCLHLWMPMGADPFPDLFGDRANTVAP